ncbi:MAG: hypothetical protein RB191_24955 [Terriglobia bacterium]|nr:hypothetical protein [Terriglobia bacterium]
MFHMIAYEQSASLAALTAITPVPDGTVSIQGNDITVPDKLNMIVGAAAMINSAAATLRAQIQAPSLRAILNFDVNPIANGLVFGSLATCMRMWQTPLQLVTNEPLDFFFQNGAAVMNRGLITLADGPLSPVKGKIYTVRATGAASLVTATWVNTSLTFSQQIPAGHYQVVGFRAIGANLVAARIFFKGSAWRPGVYAVNASANLDWPDFRYGNIGVWGEFDNTVLPSVDCLGVTDTSQEFELDLIKTA